MRPHPRSTAARRPTCSTRSRAPRAATPITPRSSRWARSGLGARSRCRSASTAHPLRTRFANVLGASLAEAAMRPDSSCGRAWTGTATACSTATSCARSVNAKTVFLCLIVYPLLSRHTILHTIIRQSRIIRRRKAALRKASGDREELRAGRGATLQAPLRIFIQPNIIVWRITDDKTEPEHEQDRVTQTPPSQDLERRLSGSLWRGPAATTGPAHARAQAGGHRHGRDDEGDRRGRKRRGLPRIRLTVLEPSHRGSMRTPYGIC